jgi:hypothetical protein
MGDSDTKAMSAAWNTDKITQRKPDRAGSCHRPTWREALRRRQNQSMITGSGAVCSPSLRKGAPSTGSIAT